MPKHVKRDPGYALDLAAKPETEVSGNVMIDNKVHDIAIPDLTLEQRHSMCKHVVEHMNDHDDARTLMNILGVELMCPLETEGPIA